LRCCTNRTRRVSEFAFYVVRHNAKALVLVLIDVLFARIDRLLGSERQEHAFGHAAAVAMDAKWLLGRAGKSGQSFPGHTFYSYWRIIVQITISTFDFLMPSCSIYIL